MKFIFILALIFFTSCSSVDKVSTNKSSDLSIVTEKADLYFSIGRSYHKNRIYEKAIEHYQESLKIKPSHSEAHFHLGKLLLRRQFLEEGLIHLKKSIKFNKDYTEARNFLAAYYAYNQKDYKKAKLLVDESAKDLIYNNQEQTWALKLKVDFVLGGKREALKSMPKVISLEARSCVSRIDITQTLYKMKFLKLALKSARIADELCLSLQDKNKIAYIKGLIFIKRKNFVVAERILEGIDTQNKSLQSKLLKAQSYVKLKSKTGI